MNIISKITRQQACLEEGLYKSDSAMSLNRHIDNDVDDVELHYPAFDRFS